MPGEVKAFYRKGRQGTAKFAKEAAQLISTEWTPGPDNLLFLFLFSHNTKASEPCCEGWYVFSRCSPLPPAAFSAFLAACSHCSVFFTFNRLTPRMRRTRTPASNSLRGTVINSVTREPIAHALVSSADNRFAAFTDDQGRFEFQLPRMESNPNSPAEGMAFYNVSAQLMARKPGFLDSGMSSSPPQSTVGDDITIALVPESLIVGRVNLPSSNQSDRITVQVYKRQVRDGRAFWAPGASATTRSNGEFRIANLMAGTYKIFTSELMDRDPITFDPRGQLYGYPPIYYPAATDFASASAITLEAGKTFQVELSPVLQPYYPVRIAVTNFQAQNGVDVSVALQGHKGPGYSLGYNGEGIEGMLPNGIYTVEATLQQGQQTATGSVNITVKDGPLIQCVDGGPAQRLDSGEYHDEGSERTVERTPSAQGGFSREQKADVFLQPADDFDSGGFASLRPPRKPNDNDLVLENVRPGRYWLKVCPLSRICRLGGRGQRRSPAPAPCGRSGRRESSH